MNDPQLVELATPRLQVKNIRICPTSNIGKRELCQILELWLKSEKY